MPRIIYRCLKLNILVDFSGKTKQNITQNSTLREIIVQDLKQTHTSTATVLTGLYICQAVVNMHSLHGKVSLYRT